MSNKEPVRRLSLDEITKRLPSYFEYLGYSGGWYHNVRCKLCGIETKRLPHNFKFNCKCNSHNSIKKREYLHKLNGIFSVISNKKGYTEISCDFCGYLGKRKGSDIHRGCPSCKNGIRTQEQEIIDFLKEIDINTTKIRMQRKEIDCFHEESRIGIEYCGLYWHAEHTNLKRVKFHINDKYLFFKNKNIRIITIFEDEWMNKKDQVKGYLRSVFNKNEIKIHGRECQVKFIDKKTANEFLDKNHIQGRSIRADFNIGIFKVDEMLGVMSGGLHHRKKDTLVLQRLCFLSGVSVSGGASKMLKLFLIKAKELGYSSVISWSDNRWSSGNVYEKMGFSLDEELRPDYSYVKSRKRYSKQSMKKRPTEKNSGKTELELRLSEGYDRIWDCGKKRWVINLKR